jgi:hypothetical protein
VSLRFPGVRLQAFDARGKLRREHRDQSNGAGDSLAQGSVAIQGARAAEKLDPAAAPKSL